MSTSIADVLPVGTPWGGPESCRYLSCLSSLLLHIEGVSGTREERQSAHERLYHLYLAVSGIGMSRMGDGGRERGSSEEMVERLFPDTVDRTMSYAGLLYSLVEAGAIREDADSVRIRVIRSIDRGVPVLARSTGSDWSIVTGYSDDGDELTGWDGSNGYWGQPCVPADGYLDDGRFASRSWPEVVDRLVVVEGPTAPRRSTAAVLRHLVEVIEQHAASAFAHALIERIADEDYCRAIPHAELQALWTEVDRYIGWYAENRCLMGFAFDEILPAMPDMRDREDAVSVLRHAAGPMMDTHDRAWEAWRALRTTHRCNLRDEEPCGQCGGCLRPSTDEDVEALREPARRGRLQDAKRAFDANDASVLTDLRACLAYL